MKTVVFFASISLILWFLSVLQINIWDQITPEVDSLMSYRIYSDSSTYQEFSYKLHGMFLYSHRTVDMRNVSIFTEPGIYQMVLNTAIFVLLFLRDKLVSFSDKKVGRALMILSCALLSTQSTTGYKDRIVTSIQGLVSVYYDHYSAGLPDYIMRRKTLSEIKGKCSLPVTIQTDWM